jgi:Ser/Thr protein kinase RdoA (MazF antagonist)
LEDALASLDDGCGLPQAFIHPDFVLANVVAAEDGTMVLVDWAGAGRGPRLWSLAFLLWVEGAKDLRRVDLAMAGYRRAVTLTEAELSALPAMLPARALVFDIWRLAHRSWTAGDAAASWPERRELAERIAERVRAG